MHLPRLGVRLHLDFSPGMRNGHRGNRRPAKLFGLESSQARARDGLAAGRSAAESPRIYFLNKGLVLIGWPLVQLLQMPGTIVAKQLKDMLRM